MSLLQQAAKRIGPEKLNSLMSSTHKKILPFTWEVLARKEQRPDPNVVWDIWLYLAGRGSGKTRSGAELVRKKVKHGIKRIHLVGRTVGDVRDVMIEGESGILSVCADWDKDIKGNKISRPHYEPSKRRVVWSNGATAYTFTSEKPDQLRGPQCEFAWADELAAWGYLQDTWDMLLMGLRLGIHPQVAVTTTPRALKIIKELLKDPTCYATRGTSYDNKENLAKAWYDRIIKRYEGTRIGRQELMAEVLEDNPDALFKRDLFDQYRVHKVPDDLLRVVIGIDPAGSTSEDAADTGIVAAGKDWDDHYYILSDKTCHEKPNMWGQAAIKEYDRFEADRVVGEANFGGDMVEHVIRSITWPSNQEHTKGEDVSFLLVRAARGKAVRAEPISSLQEQGRLHVVGHLSDLEDECCQWAPGGGGPSPNRLDAMVWAITALMGEPTANIRML